MVCRPFRASSSFSDTPLSYHNVLQPRRIRWMFTLNQQSADFKLFLSDNLITDSSLQLRVNYTFTHTEFEYSSFPLVKKSKGLVDVQVSSVTVLPWTSFMDGIFGIVNFAVLLTASFQL